ncbi:hypothetical protein [Paenibacillus oleatilyticus]|uniref:hypothetical protein n=1 Tax=Paenibacillus oleatilyticus TaxID=2594886 RepID=UPI001C1F7D94|nr:hypothetical protein [Paenibacillus oleatilyticus]MBU7316020.1 hypothetical protein [Paenibacillus oleatilyticus]
MSKYKLSGSQIRYIKRENESTLIIKLYNGEQLQLKAEPTDWGYDAAIRIKKLDAK